ncbi:MAG: hypothetical protein KME28_11645 [Pelatocladus maniniholoensis HA4357-MV3]|jgi:hypothetical protein|uniref:SPOR domain-containing protein n=1 Tax=Pelatocladus maniniholoensis HA4357-MV3 TaxID=1117104 RepID=A0A9E3LT95_9NOST|nr:hypothetical protein [Pelatocladus maniniholoensis HA4357-MV3]
MSQNPVVDSGAKSSKTPELKPVLAAALASLEVQLDQELARYRRTRFTYKTLSQTRMGSPISSKFQQIIATSTTEVKTPSPVTNCSEEISLPQFSTTATQTSEPDTQEQVQVPRPVKEESTQQQRTSTIHSAPVPNSASIVPALIKTDESENIVKADDIPKPPNDYLESSEALLRSLTEEQSPTQKRKNSHDSLLSPLGIGSMLLLLMASLSLSYAVFNLKSLPSLSFGGLFKKNTPNHQPPTNNQPKITAVAQPELTPIPKIPNLETSEFPEVKNPDDVVGLTPKPKPTLVKESSQVTQNPTIAPETTTEAQPTFSPIASPTVAAGVIPTTPKPTPSLQNIDDPGIKPSTDGFFHIIINNKDEKSFATVRQVVPDAYLSKDKKLIYLGAFKTKEQVKKQMQFLQSQGITAKVE